MQIFGSEGILHVEPGYLPSVKFLADPSWSLGRTKKQWQDVSSAGIDVPEPLVDGGLLAGNVLAARDLIASVEHQREPQMSVARGGRPWR